MIKKIKARLNVHLFVHMLTGMLYMFLFHYVLEGLIPHGVEMVAHMSEPLLVEGVIKLGKVFL